MDSRHLDYFRRIVEAGSVSAAARALGMAQPSLSQHLRNLEADLGVELLTRTPRGVRPTEAGRILCGHAERIGAAMAAAAAETRAAGDDPAGPVRFGLPASVSMALSTPLAETVRHDLPRVALRTTEAMSGHIKAWIADGALEMGLVYDLSGLEGCAARPVLTEALHFVCAPDAWPFDTAPGTPVALRDAMATDLILPSMPHGLRALLERTARAERLSPNVVQEMDSLQQIKALVARGSGSTILSSAAIHDMTGDGRLIAAPLTDPAILRPVHFVRAARAPLTAASRAVERLCDEVIRDLVARGIWRAALAPDQAAASVPNTSRAKTG